MGVLKFLLWLFLVILMFSSSEGKSEAYMNRVVIEFVAVIVCLTIVYTFGGKH